jgi:hypothetical protein
MCDFGVEGLPWETCGSVDAGGSGEPEVDSLSSSSESMANSFRGSGNCFAGRKWKEIRRYIRIHYCPLLFLRDASRNRWHHTEVAVSCVITWLPPNHRNSKRHRMSFTIQPMWKICCTFTAAYVRGPGYVLVANLASEIQMIHFSLLRWGSLFRLQTSLHRKCKKSYLHY